MSINKNLTIQYEHSEKIVIVPGNFNVVHAGHIRIFEFAKSFGYKLVVILFEDGADIQVSLEDRSLALNAISMIDEIISISHKSYMALLKEIRPFIAVKGREHENRENIEQIITDWGGHLIFAADKTVYSARKLFDLEIKENRFINFNHDHKFLENKNINLKNCIKIVLN